MLTTLSHTPDMSWDTSRPPIQHDYAVDLLVMSATWFRMRKSGTSFSSDCERMVDPRLLKHITPEDRVHAEAIRDYYSKKIMMSTLLGAKLSKFRSELNRFLHSDGKTQILETIIPLVYSLPEFFEYDTKFDKLKLEQFSGKVEATHPIDVTKKLKTVEYIKIKKAAMTRHEYWMKDADNKPNLILLENGNQLKPLWDSYFKKPELTIEGRFAPTFVNDILVYKISKWRLDEQN